MSILRSLGTVLLLVLVSLQVSADAEPPASFEGRTLRAGGYALRIPAGWDVARGSQLPRLKQRTLAGLVDDVEGEAFGAFQGFATAHRDNKLENVQERACMASFYELKRGPTEPVDGFLDHRLAISAARLERGRVLGGIERMNWSRTVEFGEFRAVVVDWTTTAPDPGFRDGREFTFRHPDRPETAAVISTLCYSEAFRNADLTAVIRTLSLVDGP